MDPIRGISQNACYRAKSKGAFILLLVRRIERAVYLTRSIHFRHRQVQEYSGVGWKKKFFSAARWRCRSPPMGFKRQAILKHACGLKQHDAPITQSVFIEACVEQAPRLGP